MARTAGTRGKSKVAVDKVAPKVKAALSKAVGDVRRRAAAENITLPVADRKSWFVPK